VRSAAVVPAAGGGERLGAGVPKALCRLRGEPLVAHAVRTLVAAGAESIVIAAAPTMVLRVGRLLRPVTGDLPVVVVAGGASRRESVAACLAELPDDADAVLVHDAARPLVPPVVVERVLAALRAGADAVVPVVPVDDTVKEVAEGRVVRTVDRVALRAVQTPQGFRREVLVRAHAGWRGAEPTDDAAMVEALGLPVSVVEGSRESFKITRPLDLALAEAVLATRA
jgi:2-C-methyl-D-erythritol 4-phosphate cytidylyltransferase